MFSSYKSWFKKFSLKNLTNVRYIWCPNMWQIKASTIYIAAFSIEWIWFGRVWSLFLATFCFALNFYRKRFHHEIFWESLNLGICQAVAFFFIISCVGFVSNMAQNFCLPAIQMKNQKQGFLRHQLKQIPVLQTQVLLRYIQTLVHWFYWVYKSCRLQFLMCYNLSSSPSSGVNKSRTTKRSKRNSYMKEMGKLRFKRSTSRRTVT